MRPFLLLLFAAGLLATRAPGAERRWTAGPRQTALIELYTSEGCSSCPPAEAWLGKLRDAPGLWRDFVPVAFHVNYWDRLGWPDEWASREFTAREYAYAEAWRSRSVYTPCFVRNGAEWHPAREPAWPHAESGVLTASWDGGYLRADYESPSESGSWSVHAALLGCDIVSRVKAGENRGRTLRHEFVALKLVEGEAGQPLALRLPAEKMAGRYAIAIWITRPGDIAIVQATGGWLD